MYIHNPRAYNKSRTSH